jgi:hypothetical protein
VGARLKRKRVVGGAEGRKRRQIHVRPEKVGTSFCLHFVLFSSRDYLAIKGGPNPGPRQWVCVGFN